jgi:hypothetical protein
MRDTIDMAEEAGAISYWHLSKLKAFEALVRADERDACAKVCDSEAGMHERLDRNGRSRHIDDAAVAKTCAAAIRARGNT